MRIELEKEGKKKKRIGSAWRRNCTSNQNLNIKKENRDDGDRYVRNLHASLYHCHNTQNLTVLALNPINSHLRFLPFSLISSFKCSTWHNSRGSRYWGTRGSLVRIEWLIDWFIFGVRFLVDEILICFLLGGLVWMRLVAQRNEHAEAAGVGSGTRRRSEEADCGSGHMRRWIVVPHVL